MGDQSSQEFIPTSIIEKEKAKPHLIFLPHVKEKEENTTANSWENFSIPRLEENIKILDGISAEELSDPEAQIIVGIRQNIHRQLDLYRTKIDGSFETPRVVDALNQTLSTPIEIYNDLLESVHTLAEFLQPLLRTETANFVPLSDSHLSTYGLLEAIENLGIKDVGLVVFDRHFDFYFSWADKLVALTPEVTLDVGRRNFLQFALDEGKLKAISILGPPTDEVEAVVRGNGKFDQELSPTFTYLEEHADSLRVVNSNEYVNPDGRIDLQKFDESVKSQVDMLARAGVKNILVSLDFDVLRLAELGYTPTEYNPIAGLIYLGSQDLSNLDQEIRIDLEKESAPVTGQKINQKRAAYFINNFSRAISSKYKADEGDGMPLSVIGRAMDVMKKYAQKKEMNFGIKLPSGGSLLFDITELNARDYKLHASKAVSALIQRINQ